MLKARKSGSENIARIFMKPVRLTVLTRCKPGSWMIRFLAKERKRNFELSKSDLFRYHIRYFKDSGVIGAKEFVSANYQRFKTSFFSKHEKKPKPIKGVGGCIR
ncbi:MAG: hypothetical protein WAN36_05075 [Calditrichia bacterium]